MENIKEQRDTCFILPKVQVDCIARCLHVPTDPNNTVATKMEIPLDLIEQAVAPLSPSWTFRTSSL